VDAGSRGQLYEGGLAQGIEEDIRIHFGRTLVLSGIDGASRHEGAAAFFGRQHEGTIAWRVTRRAHASSERHWPGSRLSGGDGEREGREGLGASGKAPQRGTATHLPPLPARRRDPG